MFNCFLDSTAYTWKNVLLWGNFTEHYKKAKDKNLNTSHRLFHATIAGLEFFPFISQIVSIFEKIFAAIFEKNLNHTFLFFKKISKAPNDNLDKIEEKIRNQLAMLNQEIKAPDKDFETIVDKVRRIHAQAEALKKEMQILQSSYPETFELRIKDTKSLDGAFISEKIPETTRKGKHRFYSVHKFNIYQQAFLKIHQVQCLIEISHQDVGHLARPQIEDIIGFKACIPWDTWRAYDPPHFSKQNRIHHSWAYRSLIGYHYNLPFACDENLNWNHLKDKLWREKKPTERAKASAEFLIGETIDSCENQSSRVCALALSDGTFGEPYILKVIKDSVGAVRMRLLRSNSTHVHLAIEELMKKYPIEIKNIFPLKHTGNCAAFTHMAMNEFTELILKHRDSKVKFADDHQALVRAFDELDKRDAIGNSRKEDERVLLEYLLLGELGAGSCKFDSSYVMPTLESTWLSSLK